MVGKVTIDLARVQKAVLAPDEAPLQTVGHRLSSPTRVQPSCIGVIRATGSAMGGVVRVTLISPSVPPSYVPTVRTATALSASEVSAPPYGRPCSQTGHS